MRTYKKPEIYFEHFELSEHIAACDYKLTFADGNNCSATNQIEDDYAYGETIFLIEGLCTGVTNDYCYYKASSGLTTHMS